MSPLCPCVLRVCVALLPFPNNSSTTSFLVCVDSSGHCILPTRLARALFRLNAKESTAMIQAASLVIMYGRIRLTVGKKAS